MQFSSLLIGIFRFLLPAAVIATAYLYFYPAVQQCAFPTANLRTHEEVCTVNRQETRSVVTGEKAPFRLLALADPQLEGDSSVHDAHWESLRGLLRGSDIPGNAFRFLADDIPQAFLAARKRLDLRGNDLYLRHVFSRVSWWTDPTHVVVLGDLLGSQWISDDEFARRSTRFWHAVFDGGRKVEERITDTSVRSAEVLGMDQQWRNRIIAVAGNHDVGYAGDLDEARLRRFEDAFGRVNWEVRFRLNQSVGNGIFGIEASPELRLVVLNSMNLDEPAWSAALREESLEFLESKLHQEPVSRNVGTVLLTHIPLYKEGGICADGPFFDYFESEHGGGIREQNHLSKDVSERILDGIVRPGGTGRGLVINGHDHVGCGIYHWRNSSDGLWNSKGYYAPGLKTSTVGAIGVREITVRSMMGDFGGNAGLLSGWWDNDRQEWQFEYGSCILGVQHFWWGVHVLDIIEIALGVGALVAAVVESRPPQPRRSTMIKKTV